MLNEWAGPEDIDRRLIGTSVLDALFKTPDLNFGLVFGETVNLPDFPDKLIALSRNRVQINVGQLCPLLPDVAPKLLFAQPSRFEGADELSG